MGVFWPCPDEGHPGTPRLFEGGRFNYPDGTGPVPPRRRSGRRPRSSTTSTRSGSPPGGSISQYLSGTQTRRIGPLVAPVPRAAVRDAPAASPNRIGIADGDLVTVTSRRGIDHRCPPRSSTTIRPDTVFIPYHWPGDKAANQLTNRALDPMSKIPEFKVVRGPASSAPAAAQRRRPTSRDLDLHDGRTLMDARPVRHRRRRRCSSSTRAAASAAKPACRPAQSAAPTAASR